MTWLLTWLMTIFSLSFFFLRRTLLFFFSFFFFFYWEKMLVFIFEASKGKKKKRYFKLVHRENGLKTTQLFKLKFQIYLFWKNYKPMTCGQLCLGIVTVTPMDINWLIIDNGQFVSELGFPFLWNTFRNSLWPPYTFSMIVTL